jgi:hypothetical protein
MSEAEDEMFDALTDKIIAENNGVLLKILRLHRPTGSLYSNSGCYECWDGEGDPPSWPCNTAKLIAEHAGVGHEMPLGRFA